MHNAKNFTRDQQRAVRAYELVGDVSDRKGYAVVVNDVGAHILRSGLAAALASLERNDGKSLLGHLAKFDVPGLENATGDNLSKRVRELELDEYIFATREFLLIATWLKRASQATKDS
ncbi:MAG: type III-B CRISPR module-associated protein Cmr5 [Bradymonadaceae bacterium]|nr:type III-B CRISPR module-associated protein Cmr5 [Lujinxingiaceae bacterium]